MNVGDVSDAHTHTNTYLSSVFLFQGSRIHYSSAFLPLNQGASVEENLEPARSSRMGRGSLWSPRKNAHISTYKKPLTEAVQNARAKPSPGTKLVVKDGGLDVCTTLLNDKKYADAVDIVGLHYPNDFQDFSATKLSQQHSRHSLSLS